MKRLLVLTVMIVLIFSLSLGAAAFSLQVDGTYLLNLEQAPKLRGLSLSANGEVYPNLLLDGSFLSVKSTEPDTSERLIRAGGLYRVVTEADLHVFVGLGFASFKDTPEENESESEEDGAGRDYSGQGLYGKLGFKSTFSPRISLMADLGYAPKFKIDEHRATLLAARASVGYQVIDYLALQVKVEHYRIADEKDKSRTLIGGGVAVSF